MIVFLLASFFLGTHKQVKFQIKDECPKESLPK